MQKLQIFNAFDNLLTKKKLDLFIFLSSGMGEGTTYIVYTYCGMKLIDNLFNFTTWLVLKKVSDP